MKPFDEPHGLCSVNPLDLVAGLIGGSLFGSKGSSAPSAASPTPPPSPAAAAPPVQQPSGSQKTGAAGMGSQPSFVGAAAAPAQSGYGQKTLLGQ